MPRPTLTSCDIGQPLLSGFMIASDSALSLVAGGRDIWESADQFHFAHTSAPGDFSLRVRLESLSMADVYTKAGLMLRSSLESDAQHALLLAFGDNQPRNNNNGGIEFQQRDRRAGPCHATYPAKPLPAIPDFPVDYPNVWLGLARKGARLTAEFSRDGVTWKRYCEVELGFEAHYLGLAVTSHNETRTVAATFSHLELT